MIREALIFIGHSFKDSRKDCAPLFLVDFIFFLKIVWRVFLSGCKAKKTTDSTKVLVNFSHNSFLPFWQVSQWAVFWQISLVRLCVCVCECVCVWDSCLLSFRKTHFASRAWNNRARFSTLVAAQCGPSPARARGKLQTCHLLLLLPPPSSCSCSSSSCSSSSSSFVFCFCFCFFFFSTSSSSPPHWWLREMCLARLPLPNRKEFWWKRSETDRRFLYENFGWIRALNYFRCTGVQ